MSTKRTHAVTQWTKIGAPPAGSVSALAITGETELTLYAGTQVGLYRSTGFDGRAVHGWERLPAAPLGILCLAVSPGYAQDHTLIAGTAAGIFYTTDRGATWRAARIPLSTATILTLCFSPDSLKDGVLLAGTLEDGILYSDSHGESWSNRSFGLLDLAVYSLAISPDFSRDGLAYAGTETALYFSYNHARAWKQLDFPEGAVPVLSLAISPDFAHDQTLFAGSEQGGLYRSCDQGKSWHRLDFPAESASALLFSQDGLALLAATETGILQSADRGETWLRLVELPGAISLAVQGELLLAGTVDQGAWMTANRVAWQPLAGLSTRSLSGLLLSPAFERDGTAFLFDPQEGLWRSEDGGGSWQSLNDALPSPDIRALAASAEFEQDRTLAATSSQCLLLSSDSGDSWRTVVEKPAGLAAFSPDGKQLAVDFLGEGIRLTEDLGSTWLDVPAPWGAEGRLLVLGLGHQAHFYVVILEELGQTVSLWQGKPGEFEKVHSQAADNLGVASLWIPPNPAADRPWYAALGSQVWRFSSRKGRPGTSFTVFSGSAHNQIILALSGVETDQGRLLFACTGRDLYRSSDEKTWRLVHDFGSQPAVAFSLSPAFSEDKLVYALLVGGDFYRGSLR